MPGPEEPATTLLSLDDLHVGQRFTSGKHALDEAQITAFAGPFDPQPFHLDGEAAKQTLFGGLAASGWHTAAITMRLNVDGGLPIVGGSSVSEASSPGRIRPVPAMSFTSRARLSRSCRRARGRTAESSRCGARRATSAAKSCKRRR
jgi:MaoC like domain